MTTSGIASRYMTSTTRAAGQKIGKFTLEKLLENGPSAHVRRWIVRCECNWQSRRYESELSGGRLGCANCAYEAKRKKA